MGNPAPYIHRRVPRRDRRVMLVLLTGAPELSGYPISRAGMVSAGGVYITLARLEQAGWVTAEWEPRPMDRAAVRLGVELPRSDQRRRFYRLTPKGRENALRVLGLKDPSGG